MLVPTSKGRGRESTWRHKVMRMCKTLFWREGRWGRTCLDIVLADFDGILDDGNLSI